MLKLATASSVVSGSDMAVDTNQKLRLLLSSQYLPTLGDVTISRGRFDPDTDIRGFPTLKISAKDQTAEINDQKLLDPQHLPTVAEVKNCISRYSTIDDVFCIQKFCDRAPHALYEIFTREFINTFAGYLSKRADDLGATWDKPLTIVEVCAGNGRLTHFLNAELRDRGIVNVSIIATDNSADQIKPAFHVENLEAKLALEKYKPQIVICSWMSCGLDLTPEFRACSSVKEYLLIGEPFDGCCATESAFYGPWRNNSKILEEVSQHQFCRTDYVDARKASGFSQHSQTLSFIRPDVGAV